MKERDQILSHDAQSFPVPTTPIPAGEFTLRTWEETDADWYVAARDEEIFRWTREPRDLPVEALRSVIRQNAKEPRFIAQAIIDRSGALLGNIALRWTPAEPVAGEISYWLAESGRGRGAASAAVAALCHWAFANLPIKRVWLKTDHGNDASQAVARRCGFIQTHQDDRSVYFDLKDP